MQRIVMSRRVPWRAAHPGAVRVDRATRWGNPFTVQEFGSRAAAVARYEQALEAGELGVTRDEIRAELAGHDLACWCPLDDACHADVLLRIADG